MTEVVKKMESVYDYLYCERCDVHVPCLRVDDGWWEVECSGCVGECGVCNCHLQKYCFGSRGDFPPLLPEKGERPKVAAVD